jgi:hypothetical protein
MPSRCAGRGSCKPRKIALGCTIRPAACRPGSEEGIITRNVFILLLACGLATATGAAQGRAETFKARLSPLGVTNATVNTTTGVGSVTATLTGNHLAIDGTFQGLTGNATTANLRRGPKGIPGPVVFEIECPKSSSGAIKASVELTPAQVEDLRAGRLYLQIHSERAPEGSIRGWLLK